MEWMIVPFSAVLGWVAGRLASRSDVDDAQARGIQIGVHAIQHAWDRCDGSLSVVTDCGEAQEIADVFRLREVGR